MKAINEMSLLEVAEYCESHSKYQLNPEVATRLSELHDLTRWIPVSEKLPTEADADRHGYVIIREVENESPKRVFHAMVQWNDIGKPDYFCTITDWKRIDP